jgi:hypothetical protein
MEGRKRRDMFLRGCWALGDWFRYEAFIVERETFFWNHRSLFLTILPFRLLSYLRTIYDSSSDSGPT